MRVITGLHDSSSPAGIKHASYEAVRPHPAPTRNDAGRMWTEIAGWLSSRSIRTVFGLPDDDMVAATALSREGITLEWAVSQRTLTHMATGLALAENRLAVCVFGRGPAVAASVPALLEAYASHAAVLILATGTSAERRHERAFQDAPTLEMVRPVTRWAVRVEHAEDLALVLSCAEALLTDGRGGPVYIEIAESAPASRSTGGTRRVDVDELLGALASAQRPLILIGGGIPASAADRLTAFADAADALVLVTASGRGSFPEHDPRHMGLSGFYMPADVTGVVADADLVVSLGSALEETAVTGMPLATDWIQVNIAPEGVNHSIASRHVIADATDLPLPRRAKPALWGTSHSSSRAVRTASRSTRVLTELQAQAPAAVVVHENGLHDMWSYDVSAWRLRKHDVDVAPSEMTTLGFGAAAALGIAASGERLVIAFVGDGALMTIFGDLPAFLSRPVRLLYVVFDDGGLGWLDREASENGAGVSFRWSSAVDLIAGTEAVIALDEEDSGARAATDASDRDAIARAVSRASAGRLTILRLPCVPDDVAPFLKSAPAQSPDVDGSSRE